MRFGLTDDQYQILDALAIRPLKKAGAKVWIFGSRARGDHQKYSDIDLLISLVSGAPGLIGSIAEKLEESALPFKVDLVLEPELAESYRESILEERRAL